MPMKQSNQAYSDGLRTTINY